MEFRENSVTFYFDKTGGWRCKIRDLIIFVDEIMIHVRCLIDGSFEIEVIKEMMSDFKEGFL